VEAPGEATATPRARHGRLKPHGCEIIAWRRVPDAPQPQRRNGLYTTFHSFLKSEATVRWQRLRHWRERGLREVRPEKAPWALLVCFLCQGLRGDVVASLCPPVVTSEPTRSPPSLRRLFSRYICHRFPPPSATPFSSIHGAWCSPSFRTQDPGIILIHISQVLNLKL